MQHPFEKTVQVSGAKATFRTLSTKRAEVELELDTPTIDALREGNTANALQRILAVDIELLRTKFNLLSLGFAQTLNSQGAGITIEGVISADADRPWQVSPTHIVLQGFRIQTSMSATAESDQVAELSFAESLLDALRQAEEAVRRRSYEVITKKELAEEN